MLSLISKIPGVVWIGGVALAVAATMWFRIQWVENERDTARAERDLAVTTAEANQATIDILQGEAARLDALLIRADERERVIRDQARRDRADVERVSNENPDVEDYLSQPVPDALRRLLNAPPADENGNSETNSPEGSADPL